MLLAERDLVHTYYRRVLNWKSVVRQPPLLKIFVTLVALALSWGNTAWAEETGLSASTLVETTATGGSTESTFGGPTAEFASTAVGSFDPSMFLVLCLGTAGLIWVRRYVRSL